MGALSGFSGLPADRVPPGIDELAERAALLRYFLSENHRGGVRHRIPLSAQFRTVPELAVELQEISEEASSIEEVRRVAASINHPSPQTLTLS